MLNLHKMPEFTFPENFIWGSGTAAHQIEGNNTNNQWWAKEQSGKYPGIREPSGKACNSWEMLDDVFKPKLEVCNTSLGEDLHHQMHPHYTSLCQDELNNYNNNLKIALQSQE